MGEPANERSHHSFGSWKMNGEVSRAEKIAYQIPTKVILSDKPLRATESQKAQDPGAPCAPGDRDEA